MTHTNLRDHLATALRNDLRTRTAPIPGLGGGMGLTEYDLADSVLPVVQAELQKHEQLLNDAYTERSNLLAWLAAIHHAVLAPAIDVEEPGWYILFLRTRLDGPQMTWHISPRDVCLFAHVLRVDADSPLAQWDGHITAEKYELVRSLTFAELRGDTR